jgi:hypothetical protein
LAMNFEGILFLAFTKEIERTSSIYRIFLKINERAYFIV